MTAAARERMRVRLPLLAASAAAWLVLLVRPHEAAVCTMPSMRWTPASLLAASALMFAAMMVPLIAAPVAHVRDRSFARRRLRATALFIASYGLPWIAAGVGLLWGASWIVASGATSVTLAIGAIALWQCSPWKQRCLNRCHAHTELAAFGVSADLDVLRFGFTHAWWCIGACSGLMLLPMLFPSGHLAAMFAITLWLAGERVEKPRHSAWRWRGPGNAWRIAVGQARIRLQSPVHEAVK